MLEGRPVHAILSLAKQPNEPMRDTRVWVRTVLSFSAVTTRQSCPLIFHSSSLYNTQVALPVLIYPIAQTLGINPLINCLILNVVLLVMSCCIPVPLFGVVAIMQSINLASVNWVMTRFVRLASRERSGS